MKLTKKDLNYIKNKAVQIKESLEHDIELKKRFLMQPTDDFNLDHLEGASREDQNKYSWAASDLDDKLGQMIYDEEEGMDSLDRDFDYTQQEPEDDDFADGLDKGGEPEDEGKPYTDDNPEEEIEDDEEEMFEGKQRMNESTLIKELAKGIYLARRKERLNEIGDTDAGLNYLARLLRRMIDSENRPAYNKELLLKVKSGELSNDELIKMDKEYLEKYVDTIEDKINQSYGDRYNGENPAKYPDSIEDINKFNSLPKEERDKRMASMNAIGAGRNGNDWWSGKS